MNRNQYSLLKSAFVHYFSLSHMISIFPASKVMNEKIRFEWPT